VQLILISMIVGMMISAFAKAGQVLGDTLYLQRALEAIQFVQKELYRADFSAATVSGRLLRSCYVDSSMAGIAHRFVFLSIGKYCELRVIVIVLFFHFWYLCSEDRQLFGHPVLMPNVAWPEAEYVY